MRNRNSTLEKFLKNAKTKLLLVPILMTTLLVVILVTVLINGSTISKSQYEKLNEQRRRLSSLEEKLSILRNVQSEQLSQSETVMIALPSKNPGLWMMSQLKSLASSEDITLKDTKMGQQIEGDDDIQKAIIEIISKGDLKSTLSFIEKLRNLAPVNSVDSVYLRSKSGDIIATSRINIYWSPLPKTLPEISSSIKNLSQDEIQLLSDLSKLTKPEFTSGVSAIDSGSRSNPFAQ